ncbi:MAG: tetratricopeptide repeat protein, partial [Allomuricauda sp.]
MKGFKLIINRRKGISLLYLLSFIIACCFYSHFADDILLVNNNQISNKDKSFLRETDYIFIDAFLDFANTIHLHDELNSNGLMELQNLWDETNRTINSFDASCQMEFDQPEILYTHARILIAQQRYKDAETHLIRACSKFTNLGESERMLMYVYHRSKKWNQLQKLANEIISSTNNFPEAKNYLNIARNQTKYLTVLERKAKEHPTPQNFLQLSKEFFLENQFAQSYHYAQKTLTLQPKLSEAYIQLGLVYYKL